MNSLPLSPGGRRYGAFRSKPDHRDFGVAKMKSLLRDPAIALPTSVDLAPFCGPVRDQGQLGACTAFASTAMLEFLFKKYKGKEVMLSPEFQYYQERVMDGDLSQGDTGSTGRTAVRCLNQFGVCTEADDVYSDTVSETPPTEDDVQEALLYRAGAYHALSNVQDMKLCLASGYTFIVGFSVYDSFESSAMASSGLMPVPDKTSETVVGGHEVHFVGYDDSIVCPGASAGAFKVQNSWGTSWGQSGFFYFPYQCASDPSVLMDAFIQHFGKPW
jgi:C1A family cysteine protease